MLFDDEIYDIPKVTIKMNNQDRMFFADFSLNSQQIFMKFCKHYFSKESQQPWKFCKII